MPAGLLLSRSWQRERRERVLLLASDAEQNAAGGQNHEVRRGAKQAREVAGRVGHLLTGVEYEQQTPPIDSLRDAVEERRLGAVAHRQGDRGGNQPWVVYGREVHEQDTVGKVGCGDGRNGETRLPNSTWPSESQQAHACEQSAHRGYLRLTAD
jgi:hypothetical protein